MFGDASLWLVIGSMASTAGLLGLWLDRSAPPGSDDDGPGSQLD